MPSSTGPVRTADISLSTLARNLLSLSRLSLCGTRVIHRILTTLSTVVGGIVAVSTLVVYGVRSVGTDTLESGAFLLASAVQLLAGLAGLGLP